MCGCTVIWDKVLVSQEWLHSKDEYSIDRDA